MLADDNYLTKKMDVSTNNGKGTLFEWCYDWLEMFSQATIFVVVMLMFVFRIVSVSGASMRNTLFDGDRLVINKWYYRPENRDVVVVNRGQHLDKPIIKRVIATEGQTLKIDYNSGTVTVDGVELDEYYILEKMTEKGDSEIPVVIPKGYTFVMGDNRNNSWDSRFTAIGLIKNEDIVGKAVCRIYPFDRIGRVY